MARRIHITVSEAHYVFLNEEADRSSLSMAELVRRALDTTYLSESPPRVIVIEHTLGRRPGLSVDRDGPRYRDAPRWRANV